MTNIYEDYEKPINIRETHYERDESECVIVLEQEERNSSLKNTVIVPKFKLKEVVNQLKKYL
jgi:hypothetical protein